MIRAPAPIPAQAALLPEQIRAFTEASRRAKKVRRCAGVAALGGWTSGTFGVLSLMGLLLGFSFSGLFISFALIAVAFGEFHGAAMVRRFDPRGARRLALNQIGLGIALVIYAAWSMVAGLREGAGAGSGDAQVDAMIAGITRAATLGIYGSLIFIGIVAPGLTAWYYASREKIIREFAASTDATVVEALKAA